jgi:antibiotic biosynthesis monooxygenase (ABM) superfamily enzyme
MRPAPGSGSREYGIVRKFADRESVLAFYEGPIYREWATLVGDLTDGPVHREELTGLESWFTPTEAPLRALPKWKMAIATFLGVWPVAGVLGVVLLPWLASWNGVVRSAVFNACIVTLLTWIVMPLVTRVLGPWLRSEGN